MNRWQTTLLAVLSVVVAVGVYGGAELWIQTQQTAADNRDLACRLGSFFIGQPIQRQPQQAQADFEELVRKGEGLLRSLKSVDCTQVKGARITTEQIKQGLRALHHAAPKGGGHLQSGSPPGQQPGGSTPPGPSGSTPNPQPKPEPGGNPPPHHEPPPKPPPPPPPKPSPPPEPKPGPVDRITHLVCHVTVGGVRVCVRVPAS